MATIMELNESDLGAISGGSDAKFLLDKGDGNGLQLVDPAASGATVESF